MPADIPDDARDVAAAAAVRVEQLRRQLDVAVRARLEAVAHLRAMGLGYTAIARAIDVSKGRAQQLSFEAEAEFPWLRELLTQRRAEAEAVKSAQTALEAVPA